MPFRLRAGPGLGLSRATRSTTWRSHSLSSALSLIATVARVSPASSASHSARSSSVREDVRGHLGVFEFDGRRVLEDNVRRALRALFRSAESAHLGRAVRSRHHHSANGRRDRQNTNRKPTRPLRGAPPGVDHGCRDGGHTHSNNSSFGPEKALGEFVFHPSSPDAAEDDGVLMGYISLRG